MLVKICSASSKTHQDNIPEGLVVLGPNHLNITTVSDPEEVPGDGVDEDIGHDGGGVTDGSEAASLVRTFRLD